MFWETLLCARWVEAPGLAHAVATALGIAAADVVVVDDMQELLGGVADRARLIVRRDHARGQFQMQLVLMPQEQNLVWGGLQTGVALSRALNMPILLPDDTDAGNERWIAVKPDGSINAVLVDDSGHEVVRQSVPVRQPIPA